MGIEDGKDVNGNIDGRVILGDNVGSDVVRRIVTKLREHSEPNVQIRGLNPNWDRGTNLNKLLLPTSKTCHGSST